MAALAFIVVAVLFVPNGLQGMRPPPRCCPASGIFQRI